MEYRIERDSMGEVSVPVNKYWAAQTQRSLENFPIGEEKMPFQIIKAFSLIKKACALTNNTLGKLDDERCDIICKVCEEIEKGGLDGNFPLSVWQTGSGTQSNMNVNEVIAGRGNELAGKKLLHPNDHVNMSQSSNDTFPTAMHIAAYTEVTEKLIPSIDKLIYVFEGLEDENRKVIKIGRTHLQDAVPLSFSQEISAWRTMLVSSKESILLSLSGLLNLALGATAVGTGLNAPKDFDKASASKIAEISGHPFVSAKNKFHALSSKDEITFAHGALKALAADLMKIANDIRWLSSGPRCGLGEITIPENEPGSSIMPGKVNPTQCEALTMVAARVMGNDVCIGIAASQGNFQLNVYMPLIAYSFLQSVTLLADSINSFCDRCALGIKANEKRMNENLNRSLMLVTALSPHIGYDKAAEAAKKAHSENISLKEAVLSLGYMTADEFDSAAVPEKMV